MVNNVVISYSIVRFEAFFGRSNMRLKRTIEWPKHRLI